MSVKRTVPAFTVKPQTGEPFKLKGQIKYVLI